MLLTGGIEQTANAEVALASNLSDRKGQEKQNIACAISKQPAENHKQADRWFARDKAQHFVAGALIAGATSYRLVHKDRMERRSSLSYGMGFSVGLGLIKEVLDWRRPFPRNHFCWKDLMFDCLGAITGIFLLGWW